MWLLIAFVIHHVYSAWLMDVKERDGVMSSIFGGYKAVKRKE
jgi:Ni/Fe-hydrogenase 1 B-type cytochrome subunit